MKTFKSKSGHSINVKSGSVKFDKDGLYSTDDKDVISILENAKGVSEVESEDKPFNRSKAKKDELIAYAADNEIDLGEAKTADEIRNAIKEAETHDA